MFNLIFGIIFDLVAIALAYGSLVNFELGAGNIIPLVISILFFIAGIQLIFRFVDKKKYNSKVIAQFPCVHLSGLPLGEISCMATALENRIIFKVDKSTFELSYDKITAADLREKSELTGSSAGSIVAGAVLFGTLGAVIAARPKNKKEYILAISYISDGDNRTIAVAVPYENGYIADRAIGEIKRNIAVSQNVVL